MSDIDWVAVETVCTGGSYSGLDKPTMTAIIRRLDHRIRNTDDSPYAEKISLDDISRRLGTTERMVLRIREALPAVKRMQCDWCHETVFVSKVIEPHHDPDPKKWNETCRMSGKPPLTGLAATRPPKGRAARAAARSPTTKAKRPRARWRGFRGHRGMRNSRPRSKT